MGPDPSSQALNSCSAMAFRTAGRPGIEALSSLPVDATRADQGLTLRTGGPPSPLRNRSQREAARLRLPSFPMPDRTRPQELDSTILLNATGQPEEVSPLFPGHGAVLRDTAHIAIAVADSVGHLVTWNFKHIANAVLRSRIEFVCRQAGYQPSVICTPSELMEVDHANEAI